MTENLIRQNRINYRCCPFYILLQLYNIWSEVSLAREPDPACSSFPYSYCPDAAPFRLARIQDNRPRDAFQPAGFDEAVEERGCGAFYQAGERAYGAG